MGLVRLRKSSDRQAYRVGSIVLGTEGPLGTLELWPHAAHRTNVSVRSSLTPMISVRWLPHFGQSGGGPWAA